MTDRAVPLIDRSPDGHVITSSSLAVDLLSERARIESLPPSPRRDAEAAELVRALGMVGWWEPWIQTMAPGFVPGEFSTYQRDLWNWGVRIGPDRPDPLVACWPRGSGKTTSIQMLLLWFACLKVRPYALYIGKDQTSASTKVEAVGKLMMSDQVRAAYPQTAQMYVAETGVKRDWRRSRVRNADGFTLDALGMDVALLRGIKVDFSRPGVIILDDIEDFVDTKYMTKKRIDVLTRSIIPAAATDVVYIFVQNKIHSDSIMARLLDDRADFFGDRLVLGPYPQIEGLVTEEYRDDKDRLRHRITAGRPTWPAVLGIEVSNRQLTDEGLVAFLSEKQHETDAAEGDIFPKEHWQYRSADQLPKKLRLVRAWDLAGTEGGGDYTVGILMACDHQTGDYWILDVVRGQWAVSDVHRVVQEISEADRDRWAHGKSRYRVAIESQPGAAGKAWNDQWKNDILPGFPLDLVPAQGSKAFRADGYSSAQQSEEIFIVGEGAHDPEYPWIPDFVREHAQFGEDGAHHDDQVDAGALAYNRLAAARRRRVTTGSTAGRSLPG